MPQCPSCESSFDSEMGVKVHHAHAHNESIAKETSQCNVCNSSFKYYPSNRDGVYCHNCTEEDKHHTKELFEFDCSWCGKTKEVYKNRIENSEYNYCSSSCRGKHQSKIRHGQITSKTGKSVQCEVCNSTMEVSVSQYKSQNNFFCTEDCHNTWFDSLNVTVNCANCQEEKEVTKKKAEKHKNFFCSNFCRAKYQSKQKTKRLECSNQNCSNEIKRLKTQIEKQNATFCSPECHRDWLSSSQNPRYNGKNEVKGYGRGWYTIQRKIWERDDYRCQICGRTTEEIGRRPDVHHITPVSWFKKTAGFSKRDAHYEENLVCLCRGHHNHYEHLPSELKENLPEELVSQLEFENPESE